MEGRQLATAPLRRQIGGRQHQQKHGGVLKPAHDLRGHSHVAGEPRVVPEVIGVHPAKLHRKALFRGCGRGLSPSPAGGKIRVGLVVDLGVAEEKSGLSGWTYPMGSPQSGCHQPWGASRAAADLALRNAGRSSTSINHRLGRDARRQTARTGNLARLGGPEDEDLTLNRGRKPTRNSELKCVRVDRRDLAPEHDIHAGTVRDPCRGRRAFRPQTPRSSRPARGAAEVGGRGPPLISPSSGTLHIPECDRSW